MTAVSTGNFWGLVRGPIEWLTNHLILRIYPTSMIHREKRNYLGKNFGLCGVLPRTDYSLGVTQKVSNCVSLHITSMTRSLQMRLSKEGKKTRPIHIRSTNGYLEVLVDPVLLLNDLSTHSYSEQAWVSFLKFWTHQSRRQMLRLSVCFPVTLAGVSLRKTFSRRMQNVDGSRGLMDGKYVYLRIVREGADTWLCQAISKTEKS